MHDIPSLIADCQRQLDAAAAAGALSASAVANVRRWLTEPGYEPFAAQLVEHFAQKQLAGPRIGLLDHLAVRNRRPARTDVSDRNGHDQRPHGGRERARTGRFRRPASPARRRPAAPWPTTRAIARGISPSFVPKSWWRPVSLSAFWMAFAPRPSCRSRFDSRDVIAASWSAPAITRRRTTP